MTITRVLGDLEPKGFSLGGTSRPKIIKIGEIRVLSYICPGMPHYSFNKFFQDRLSVQTKLALTVNCDKAKSMDFGLRSGIQF